MDKLFKFSKKDSKKDLSIKCIHAFKIYDIMTKENINIDEKIRRLLDEFPEYFYQYEFMQKSKYVQVKFLIDRLNELLEPLFKDMDKYCKDTIKVIQKNKKQERKDMQKFFKYIHSLD